MTAYPFAAKRDLAAGRKAKRQAKAAVLWAKKPKRKKSPSLSKLKKLLWAEISPLVRSWSEVCWACDNRPTEVAAHIVPSNEGAATRFFLPNLYPCCVICNGLEKWNRASWVYRHKKLFGEGIVDALYMMAEDGFQLKKHWVIEQTARMAALRATSRGAGGV